MRTHGLIRRTISVRRVQKVFHAVRLYRKNINAPEHWGRALIKHGFHQIGINATHIKTPWYWLSLNEQWQLTVAWLASLFSKGGQFVWKGAKPFINYSKPLYSGSVFFFFFLEWHIEIAALSPVGPPILPLPLSLARIHTRRHTCTVWQIHISDTRLLLLEDRQIKRSMEATQRGWIPR